MLWSWYVHVVWLRARAHCSLCITLTFTLPFSFFAHILLRLYIRSPRSCSQTGCQSSRVWGYLIDRLANFRKVIYPWFVLIICNLTACTLYRLVGESDLHAAEETSRAWVWFVLLFFVGVGSGGDFALINTTIVKTYTGRTATRVFVLYRSLLSATTALAVLLALYIPMAGLLGYCGVLYVVSVVCYHGLRPPSARLASSDGVPEGKAAASVSLLVENP